MILVSVSGAQSCGKTSVLEALKKRSLGDCHVDDFKAARHALATVGLPLTTIVKDAATLIEFQTLVLDAKINHDRNLRRMYGGRDLVVFVERSPIDLASFAWTWLGPNVENSEVFAEWAANRYIPRCLEAQKEYDSLVYLPVGVFKHVDDGVRANAETQRFVDASILDYARNRANDLIEVKATTIDGRADEIISIFRNRLYPDGRVVVK